MELLKRDMKIKTPADAVVDWDAPNSKPDLEIEDGVPRKKRSTLVFRCSRY